MLDSDYFSIVYEARNAQITSAVKPQMKIISFHFLSNKNMDIQFLLDRTKNVLELDIISFNGGSLKFIFTDPFRMKKEKEKARRKGKENGKSRK